VNSDRKTKTQPSLAGLSQDRPHFHDPGGGDTPRRICTTCSLRPATSTSARVLEEARFDGCFYATRSAIPRRVQEQLRHLCRARGQLSYLDPMMVLPIRPTSHAISVSAPPFPRPSTSHTTSPARWPRLTIFRWPGVLEHRHVNDGLPKQLNFGMSSLPAPETRYDRGDEMVEACCALWTAAAGRPRP